MKQLNFYTIRNILVLLASILSFTVFGQGTVTGTVTDDAGELVIGANIILEGTDLGTVTDFDGNYKISIPAGIQTLRVTFIGYGTQYVELQIEDGGTYTANFTLTEDKLALNEVVVTGTFSKRSQKESPISMTLLNSQQLQRLSSNSQADILRTVPGITAEGGGGEVATNVFVRGLPSGGQFQFTPLQVDGLPVLSTFGLNSSAHDVYFRNDIGLRNLELVRGGSSTLFGAGSVAGIINYTSITGSYKPENRVQLEFAQGGRAKADFLASGPINDNLFYAVSGFYRYDEGPLETGLLTRGYQVRGNLKKLFNDGKSSFTLYGQLIDDNVQFYLPYPLANDGGVQQRPVGNDGETIYTMLTGQARDYSFDTPNGRFESPIGNGVTTQGGFVMLDLKHSFGNDWRLTSKTKVARYDHWFNLFLDGDGVHNTPEDQAGYLEDRGLPVDATFNFVDTGDELAAGDLLFENRVLDRQRPMSEMAGEFNLTKTINQHNITIGTFISDTRAEDNNWIYNFLGDFSNSPRVVSVTYTDSLGNLVDYSPGGFIAGRQTANRHHQSTKAAIYVADEFKADRFNLDVGFRFERARGVITRETGIGSNTFQKGVVATSDFAIAVAGLYELSDNLNLYANFSKGYFFPELRGVGFVPGEPGTPQSYETEGILQGELGTKFASKSLSATGALFYVALDGRRTIDFINDPNDPTVVIEEVKIQSTRTVGLEASANYTILKGLNVYGNFTFQNHQFTKVEGNPDQVGNKLRRQPNIMGLVGVDYAIGQFDVNLSSNFLGKKFANDANTVELDGFNIVRFDAGYEFPLGENESVRLSVSVFNALDAQGVTEGSPRQGDIQGADNEFFVGRPILPRRVFVRAGFNF